MHKIYPKYYCLDLITIDLKKETSLGYLLKAVKKPKEGQRADTTEGTSAFGETNIERSLGGDLPRTEVSDPS